MFRKVNQPLRIIASNPRFGVVIDQFDAQSFNINEAGYIRNDISQLARAQSKSEYDSIMARLVELKSQGGLPEGISTEQAISMIKPRYAQSPNEIEQFIEMTNGNVMDEVNKAYEKSLKDVKLNKESDSAEPAPASE